MYQLPEIVNKPWIPLKPPYIKLPDYAVVLTIISCATSIFGAFAIFWIYIKYPDVRTSSRRLLLFLTIADLLTASGNLLGVSRYAITYGSFSNKTSLSPGCVNSTTDDPDSAVCIFQSSVTTYSSLASFFWTAAISFFIVLPVVRNSVFTKRFFIGCHLFCWLAPVIPVIVALDKNALGEDCNHASGGWCWISSNVTKQEKVAWMIFSGKGWEIAVYIITTVNYILLKYYIYAKRNTIQWAPNKLPGSNQVPQYVFREEDRNFLFVPIVLYLLRIWGTLRFFISFAPQNNSTIAASNGLLPLQGIGDSGQAFWNFVIFFLLDSKTRKIFCNNRNGVQILERSSIAGHSESTRLIQAADNSSSKPT